MSAFLSVRETMPNLYFRWPHSVILEKEGPNDGLVSVESSKWVRLLASLLSVNQN